MSQDQQSREGQERLLRKMQSIAELTGEETQALLSLPVAVRSFAADQDIVREEDRPSACCLVLDGLVCSYKGLPAGKRSEPGRNQGSAP